MLLKSSALLFASSLFLFANTSMTNYNFSCDCSNELTKLFTNSDSHIIDKNLNEIDKNIDKTIESLDENIKRVENDIAIIQEMNKTAKLEILKQYEYNYKLLEYKEMLDKKFSNQTKEFPHKIEPIKK